MAQFRQQSGADRFSSSTREHVSIRIPNNKTHRSRRQIRPDKPHRRVSTLAVFAVTLTLGLAVTFFAFSRLSKSEVIGGEKSGPEFIPYRNQSGGSKELKFGHGSGASGRDSRYWDKDDRRRDHDYDGSDALGHKIGKKEKNLGAIDVRTREKSGSDSGFYNEGGRAELDSYKEEYEASLENGRRGSEETELENDEYDDGIDVQDDRDDEEHDVGDNGDAVGRKLGDVDVEEHREDVKSNVKESGSSEVSRSRNGGGSGHKGSGPGKSSKLKRKTKHHRSSGSSCEMKFLNSTALVIEPPENKKFSRFSLQYTHVEERPMGASNWEPRFAGHQTPQEREESFYARDQKINCGFIKGPKGSSSTEFDLAEDDRKYMRSCHIAVSSCIFGNSDHLRMPYNKLITRLSRKGVCFTMFVDELTLQTLSLEGQKMDTMGFIGLWKIVVVRNLPYNDMRRVGKIPKFLAHRLFLSARYSMWLDSKLRLQNDPYLILEYFLWRKGHEYAISNHYDRHCVWEEVAQNKKLNKYNHTVIDQQFEFYQKDGLTRFDPSDPKKLLPSYVPEGSLIIRAHTPMANLFSCLWFNEVDQFTPRDQLSFAYTYLKLTRMNPGKKFHLNMFKDCERRMIAKLYRHRGEDKRNLSVETTR